MGDIAQTAATLRDGLLQDLIAISIMLKDVSRSLTPGHETEPALQKAASTLEDDLAELRQLIRTLEEDLAELRQLIRTLEEAEASGRANSA